MQISSAVALVTGANRGLGRALVDTLLAAGARQIYAGVRDGASARSLPADPRLTPLVLDITDSTQIAAAVATAPNVNLLINNAGVLDFGSFLEATPQQVERNFATNFHGTLNMSTAFAPVIERNGGGTIVNLLTLVALASMPGLSVYNASKAAAWSMTQSLRASLAGKAIKVMGVFPGAVDTDMIRALEMPKTSAADIAKAIIEGVAIDSEDVFPDPMAAGLYAQWKQDHKAVEHQFATM